MPNYQGMSNEEPAFKNTYRSVYYHPKGIADPLRFHVATYMMARDGEVCLGLSDPDKYPTEYRSIIRTTRAQLIRAEFVMGWLPDDTETFSLGKMVRVTTADDRVLDVDENTPCGYSGAPWASEVEWNCHAGILSYERLHVSAKDSSRTGYLVYGGLSHVLSCGTVAQARGQLALVELTHGSSTASVCNIESWESEANRLRLGLESVLLRIARKQSSATEVAEGMVRNEGGDTNEGIAWGYGDAAQMIAAILDPVSA